MTKSAIKYLSEIYLPPRLNRVYGYRAPFAQITGDDTGGYAQIYVCLPFTTFSKDKYPQGMHFKLERLLVHSGDSNATTLTLCLFNFVTDKTTQASLCQPLTSTGASGGEQTLTLANLGGNMPLYLGQLNQTAEKGEQFIDLRFYLMTDTKVYTLVDILLSGWNGFPGDL